MPLRQFLELTWEIDLFDCGTALRQERFRFLPRSLQSWSRDVRPQMRPSKRDSGAIDREW